MTVTFVSCSLSNNYILPYASSLSLLFYSFSVILLVFYPCSPRSTQSRDPVRVKCKLAYQRQPTAHAVLALIPIFNSITIPMPIPFTFPFRFNLPVRDFLIVSFHWVIFAHSTKLIIFRPKLETISIYGYFLLLLLLFLLCATLFWDNELNFHCISQPAHQVSGSWIFCQQVSEFIGAVG